MIRRSLAILFLLLALMPQPASAEASGDLRRLERGDYAQLVADRRGRAFVVALWSIGCPPCLEELHLWAELLARHPALDLVLIAADSPGLAAAVADTLDRYGIARAERRIFGETSAARLRFEIDRGWRGEMPRTLFFSADGSSRVRIGAVGAAEVTDWLHRQEGSGR